MNVHQRAWKGVIDPQLERALFVRYRCKGCGYVRRVYPPGIDPGRQSVALKQICIVLHRFGLSHRTIRTVLTDLGCPLSVRSIHRNIAGFTIEPDQTEIALVWSRRVHLMPVGNAELAGADGHVRIALVGASPAERYLEIDVIDCEGAGYLRGRLHLANASPVT